MHYFVFAYFDAYFISSIDIFLRRQGIDDASFLLSLLCRITPPRRAFIIIIFFSLRVPLAIYLFILWREESTYDGAFRFSPSSFL